METNTAAELDFSFRPETYWEHNDPLEAILSDIKGEQRRRFLAESLEVGATGELPDQALRPLLDEQDRRTWGAIHPLMMGGEYLPEDLPGETEIARVSLMSTTGDTLDLRARPVHGGIRYRMVDEYETDFRLPFDSSPRPLTAGEVVQMLDYVHGMCMHMGPGVVFPPVAMNYGSGPRKEEDLDTWRRRAVSFAEVSSRFYTALGEWYAVRVESWVDSVLRRHVAAYRQDRE